MKGSWILLAFVSLSVVTSSEAVLPGMESRVTQGGLDFLREVAVEKMESMLPGQSVPSQSGGSKHLYYHFYNMRVTDFSVPESHVYVKDVMSRGVGLEVYASISVSVVGDYYLKILRIFHASGTFGATVSSASATVLVSLSAAYSPYSGKTVPSIQYKECSFNAGSVNVHLSHHPVFSKKASKMLAEELNNQACGKIQSIIDDQLQQKLKELSMEMLFYDGQFELDYSLMAYPASYSGSIDMSHKGEVDAVKYPETPPLPTPPIRRGMAASRMFYVWVSDFLVNSAGFAFHTTGMLHYTVTDKDLPPTMSMNTSGFPITTIFPEVTKLYPGMLMQLVVSSTAPPEVNTTKDKVTSYAYSDIDAYVTQPDDKLTYLFTLNLNISLSFQLEMKKQNITWVAKLESAGLDLVNSNVSGLKIDKTMLKPAINVYVIPKLNEHGATGYHLPSFKGFHAWNTNMTLANGFMKVATDLTYDRKYVPNAYLVDVGKRYDNAIIMI